MPASPTLLEKAPPSLQRILVVTQDFPPEAGGIQAYMLELVRHFSKRGHHVAVVCPGKPDAPSPLPSEIPVTRVRIHSSWLFLPLMFRLPRLIREGGYTAVIYAQWQSSLPELLISRSPGTGAHRHRSVVLAHGRELLTSVLIPFHGLLCRAAFRRADIAVPVSTAIEQLLRRTGRPRGRVARINPGVDPVRFSPGDADSSPSLRSRYGVGDAPVILALARLVPRKGHDLLIRALPGVLQKVPTARLVIGGEGPEEARLRALVAELGVEQQVTFAGRIGEDVLVDHYRMATVFAMPSRQGPRDIEGFGIVLVEAGACEVPVVATRAGGIADAVADGETGLLVPQENVDALREALLRLLQNPEESLRMGKRARQRVLEGLTWEATGDKFLALMQGTAQP